VESLLGGNSTLAIFPTGSGKSLCYQFVATQLPHLTLVVSPLLALMKDQLEFLHSKGIAAASIDSTLTPEQNKQVMNDVRSGQCKILMVSVERFKNERFRQFIESVQVSMLVVDEAHCISEWGHNFRPDYLKLPAYQKELNIPLVLLLTATATKKVKEDMAARFDIAPANIIQTGFYRPNLNLYVRPVHEPYKNQALLEEIQKQQGAGIVYVTLQNSAEEVARFLQQVDLLKGIGAKIVLDSSSENFKAELYQAIDSTGATLAFDAIGGGELVSDILTMMEASGSKDAKGFNTYGSDSNKQVYIYGGLDFSPTILNRAYGMTWSIGGWLLMRFLGKLDKKRVGELYQKVATEINTTFASSYTKELSLEEALQPENVALYNAKKTGEKYLIVPNKG
jgi:RecQ family ATP-dependent DNA helicase